MKFPYMVKHNGIDYPVGADVPIDEPKKEPTPIPFADETEEDLEAKVLYSKTEINRMALVDLKKVAKENGVDGADGKSGAELKKILIDKFGL